MDIKDFFALDIFLEHQMIFIK